MMKSSGLGGFRPKAPSFKGIEDMWRGVVDQVFELVIGFKTTDNEFKDIISPLTENRWKDSASFSKNVNMKTVKERTLEYLKTTKIPNICNAVYLELLERPVEESMVRNYVEGFMSGGLTFEKFKRGVEDSEERKVVIAKHQKSEAILNSIKNLGLKCSDFKDLIVSSSCSGLKILYMGPIGWTGYSQAAKAYVYSLFSCGADVYFKPIQEHGYINTDAKILSIKDKVLYGCISRDDVSFTPDVIILHSVPDMWGRRIAELKPKFPKSLFVGMTVWETDKIHPEWIPMMDKVDIIITPCEWNRATFSRQVTPPVYTVHNPVDMLPEPDLKSKKIIEEIAGERVMFYTINEWTGRKGIEDLVSCFLQSFTNNDNVFLYLKCSAGNHDSCKRFIDTERSRYNNPPPIYFDGRDVSDATISAIHSRGDVCCSFTRAEGTGLGAAEAVWWGNPVVMGGYGGQMDYMKGCFFISCYEERPLMCTPQQNGHNHCENGKCKIYPWYLPDQTWGHPVIDDAKRIFRFVYQNIDKCKSASVLSKMFLDEQFSSVNIGNNLGKILKKSIQI